MAMRRKRIQQRKRRRREVRFSPITKLLIDKKKKKTGESGISGLALGIELDPRE